MIISGMFHERISLNYGRLSLNASAAASKFYERAQVGIDVYISLIESIRSSLTHRHCFQLLLLLP